MTVLADAHLHLFRNGFPGRYGRAGGAPSDVDLYKSLRNVHGIQKGLVIGYEAKGIDPGNNSYVRHLAQEHDWIVSVAYLPVEPAPSPDQLQALFGQGHRGIALYLERAADADALASWSATATEQLNRAAAIISLNATPEASDRLNEVYSRLQGTTLLFSHLGLPGRFSVVPSRADAKRRLASLLGAASHRNVAVKISGLYAVSDPPEAYPHPAASPFVELLLESFGVERCLWGSDFTPSLDWVSFQQAVNLVQLRGLSPAELALVMGENLLRLLGEDHR